MIPHLRAEYLRKLSGILLHGRPISFLTLIYLHQHGLLGLSCGPVV